MDTPTPYARIGTIEIYHGKAEDLRPRLPKTDLLLTDPPYDQPRHLPKTASTNRPGKSQPRIAERWGKQGWDVEPRPEFLRDLISMSRFSIVWGGNYFGLPGMPCWFVWDKDNPAPGFADCELAWTNIPGAVRRHRQYVHSAEKKYHPTEKPLALMCWCLERAQRVLCASHVKEEPIRTVIDPYMGSGTSLLAAKMFGLSAIGIDACEEYCRIAADRIRQEMLFE